MINRHLMKEWSLRVPVAQQLLGFALVARAAGARRRGDWFGFAKYLLYAAKHVDRADRVPFYRRMYGELMELIRVTARASINQNPFLASFISTADCAAARARFTDPTPEHLVRLRLPRDDNSFERQGDLVVLKSPGAAGEKGVVLIKYNAGITSLPAVFDLPALSKSYSFVLEPSTWGYQDPIFLLYLGCDLEGWVQSQSSIDFEFVAGLESNLVPLPIGAGDWADPAVFAGPGPGRKKIYDVVMIAGWDPLKRHAEFFEALVKYRHNYGRHLSVALIGYPMSWQRLDIEELIKRGGRADTVTIFERITPAEVARLVGDSRVGILWSKREGASKALYEYLFSDVPVVVFDGHRGINLDHIRSTVGRTATDENLAAVLHEILTHEEDFSPRAWAMANTGWNHTTAFLNETLRNAALAEKRPWTRDIVGKVNSPNLRYANLADAQRFAPHFDALTVYLADKRGGAGSE